MAKTKPAHPDITNAATTLRAFWRTGRETAVRARVAGDTTAEGQGEASRPPTSAHGHKTDRLREAAAGAGMNPDTLRKAWRVAREYSAEQVDQMCSLVDRHQARFGPTHLCRLLAVRDRTARDALADRAIRGRWGLTRLGRAIQAAVGRRANVGRRPAVPVARRSEVFAGLVALCVKWERFCEAARVSLSGNHLKAVNRATTAVREVRAAVEKQLATRTTGSGRRPDSPGDPPGNPTPIPRPRRARTP